MKFASYAWYCYCYMRVSVGGRPMSVHEKTTEFLRKKSNKVAPHSECK